MEYESEQVPEKVRKSCKTLGLQVERLEREIVVRTWKELVLTAKPASNEDEEVIVELFEAKKTLLEWIEQNGTNAQK